MSDAKLGAIGPRGERGERGERGHRGHDGATGPTGPSSGAGGAGGLIKFSGTVQVNPVGTTISFLPDGGFGITPNSDAFNYPVASPRSLVDLAVFLEPPGGSSFLVELLKNGVPVPGFSVSYGAAESGVKFVVAGPVAYARGDTFDLRVTGTPGTTTGVFEMSATVGVE